MPRFYFHIHAGRSQLDLDGLDLPSREAAQLMAVRLTGETLKDEAHLVAFSDQWRMEVTDDKGAVLFEIDVRFLTPAAT